jgi:hypothetical protein
LLAVKLGADREVMRQHLRAIEQTQLQAKLLRIDETHSRRAALLTELLERWKDLPEVWPLPEGDEESHS